MQKIFGTLLFLYSCEAARQSHCWSIPHHGSYGNDGILTSFVPECGKYDDGSQCGKSGLWCPSHGGPSQPNTDLSRYGNSWRMGNNNNGGICMGESSGYPAQVGMGADSCFCWEGYQGNKATRTCEPCLKGYYKDAKQRLDISNERDGNWQWSDIVEALNKDNFGRECIMCSDGKYSDTTGSERCTDCPAGKYMNGYTIQNPPDRYKCEDCYYQYELESEGRYCPPGSPMPDGVLCGEGFFCPDFSTQTPCPNGHYSDSGQKECTPCPENSWHTLVGQSKTACQCNKGYTGPDGGPCFPCLDFSSKVVSGSSPCQCHAGYAYDEYASIQAKPGQAVCEPCHPGDYKADIGNHHCGACPVNADASADRTDCKCRDGFGSTVLPATPRIPAGQLTCQNCAELNFRFVTVDSLDAARRHKCIDCQWGTYDKQLQPPQTQHHRRLVLPGNTCECGPGFEVNSIDPDDDVCKICDNGFFKSTTSDTARCQACPDNTISFNTPHPFFDDEQSYTNEAKTDQCVCDAGFRCADGACTQCVLCPTGQWKSALGNTECQDCEEHKTTSGMQAATSPEQCVFCSLGKKYDMTHPDRCRSCPAGKFGEYHENGHAICSPCPINTYSSSEGVLECTQCDPGKKAVYDSTVCFSQICGAGSDTYDTATKKCVCSEGYVDNQHALSQWTEDARYTREFFTVHQSKNVSNFRIHLTQQDATCIDRVSAGHSKRVFPSDIAQTDSIIFFAGDAVELMIVDDAILQQPEGWVLEIRRGLSSRSERFHLDERSAYENFTVPHSVLMETQPSTLQISIFWRSMPVLKILASFVLRPDTFLGCLAAPACPSGAILDEAATASACKLCPQGKFADTEVVRCRPCEARRTTESVGTSAAASCVCDYGMQGENCTACEPGTAKAVLGPGACSPCIPGQYQNAAGQKSCEPCPFGFSSAEHGARACFPCGVGSQNCSSRHESNVSVTGDAFRYYMRLRSSAECATPKCSSMPGFFCSAGLCVNISTPCVAGHYCPGGNVSAVPCSAPPGTFCAPGLAEEIHSTCPAGFFCPGGSLDKQKCPESSTSPPNSASGGQCVCKAGFFYDAARQGCSPCFEGTYKNHSSNTQECSPCPPAQTSAVASTTSSACVCIPGYRSLLDGSCEMCPENTVAGRQNSSVCAPVTCGQNQASPPGSPIRSCLCAPGYTLINASVCSLCEPGSFKAPISDERCQPCPENHTSPSGSTSPLACVCKPGYVQTSGGACSLCPAGQFAKNQVCEPCPDLAETVTEWHQFAEGDKHPDYNEFSCSKVCALQDMTCDESALQSIGVDKAALLEIVKHRGTTWDISKPQVHFDSVTAFQTVCDPRAPFTYEVSGQTLLLSSHPQCTSKPLCEIATDDEGGLFFWDTLDGVKKRNSYFSYDINRICPCNAGVYRQNRTRWIKASKKDSCTAACADIGGACNQEAISAIGVGAIPKLYDIEFFSPTECEYFTPYQSGNYVFLNYPEESWCSKTTTCDAETDSDGQNRLCACNVPEYSQEYNEAYESCFAGR